MGQEVCKLLWNSWRILNLDRDYDIATIFRLATKLARPSFGDDLHDAVSHLGLNDLIMAAVNCPEGCR